MELECKCFDGNVNLDQTMNSNFTKLSYESSLCHFAHLDQFGSLNVEPNSNLLEIKLLFQEFPYYLKLNATF